MPGGCCCCSRSSEPTPSDPDCEDICPSIDEWSTTEALQYSQLRLGKKYSWIIPLGGNAYVMEYNHYEDDDLISSDGLGSKWTNSHKIISIYFHTKHPGDVQIVLRLSVPSGRSLIQLTFSKNTSSRLCPSLNNPHPDITNTNNIPQQVQVDAQGPEFHLLPCGIFSMPEPGYMQLDIQGLARSGPYFADMTHLILIPESNWAKDSKDIRFCADPEEFYWSRRGPSVHLSYSFPPNAPPDIEFFYSTIRIPPGYDVNGSYYCVAGFNGGYCGIQVNSPTQRSFIFSIWSGYETDDPDQIPPEYRVVCLRKGHGVKTKDFGDEGSGGQSSLVYNWVAGNTYRFLVSARPWGPDTVYTVWVCDPAYTPYWGIMACFRRPKNATWLKDIYAFSEGTDENMGMTERMGVYGDQWIRDSKGNWMEVTQCTFTATDTANDENRLDICGGVDVQSGQFFLKNCGFFHDFVKHGSSFERKGGGSPPDIDFQRLP